MGTPVIDKNTIVEETGSIPVRVKDLERLLNAAKLLISMCEINTAMTKSLMPAGRASYLARLEALDRKYRPSIALSHL